MMDRTRAIWIKDPLAILADGAERGVVVQNGKIVELVPRGGQPTTSAVFFEAGDHVVLPGLINTHHHFYQTLTRALPAALDRELFPWLTALYPVWARLTPEALDLAVTVAMSELLLSGCTTTTDHHYLFPAGLDDAVTVWKAASKMAPPKNMAIFGSSAGGNLTLAMVLRARQEQLPLPGAIAPGTPMSDLTGAGDSFQTNGMVDNVLVAYGASCDKRAALYTGGRDLKDPMLSPVYGDLRGFPPAILTSGTRDLLLSNTVRVHRKLRELGIDAVLNVFEALSHAQYQFDDRVPETKEAFDEIAGFFNSHLGK